MDHTVNQQNMEEKLRQMKMDSVKLASLPLSVRNQALISVAEALKNNQDTILKANQEDMEAAVKNQISSQVMKRLKFDEKKLSDTVQGLTELAGLPDPLFQIQLARELDEDLKLYRETCPIGVIGIIFEARPDALIQISGLCLKSGNCAILKGGSETINTNRVLFQIIYAAAVKAGIPEGSMLQAEARDEISALLSYHKYVDLLIPRGSNAFVQYIMDNTKIPVLGHADGICHIYADKTADVQKAVPIIVDSKVQYTAACNSVETLLVHREAAHSLLPVLAKALEANHVTIRGTKEVQDLIPCEPADEQDFETEYLELVVSVKLVDSVDEAVAHINRYGSHHTDCIITEDSETADLFMQLVDSAGVFRNCSTRFSDGFRYGFGAEVGISTGKIHARGPVGLEGLVTYKYKLIGNGQIVGDYAEGKKAFHFRDLA